MQGSITKFRADLGQGIIESETGRKFRFSQNEIRNPDEQLVGLEVDFLLESLNAKDIVVLHGSPWAVFGRAGVAAKRS